MLCPLILTWLALLVPPTPGGEAQAARRIGAPDGPVVAADRATSPALSRPVPRPRSSDPESDAGLPILAIETESEEESNGPGPLAPAPSAIDGLRPAVGRSVPLRPRASPPGRERRSTTHLRF